jgi:hypothetical protein
MAAVHVCLLLFRLQCGKITLRKYIEEKEGEREEERV